MHPAERNALADLDARIAAIERRLQNATASRDSFVEFLKSKYPLWSSSLTGKITSVPKDTILNRLATSDYNWDEEWDRRPRVQQPFKQPQLYQDIPIGGPFLMSDIARVRRRLKEIARNLSIVRETRLNLTTEDYFRTQVDLEAQNYENEDTLLAVRSRLNDISLMTFEPLATPTSEQMTSMKFEEQRKAYIADLRAGRALSVTTASINPASQLPLSIPQTVATNLHTSQTEVKERTEVVAPEKTDFQPQQAATLEEKPNEGRLLTFQKMQDNKTTEVLEKEIITPQEPPKKTQPNPTYKTMLELFGGHSTSDTDDDVNIAQQPPTAPAKPSSVLDKPAAPQPTSQTSSAGILSQYLAAASSKTRDSTTSDSDDDFFR